MLVGRCYDLSETPPYGPWAEALARAPRGDGLPAAARPRRRRRALASQAALFARGARLPRRPRRAPAAGPAAGRPALGRPRLPRPAARPRARARRPAAAAPRHLPRRRADPPPPALPAPARAGARGARRRASTCARWTTPTLRALVRRATPCPPPTRRGWSPTCRRAPRATPSSPASCCARWRRRALLPRARRAAGRWATWRRCGVPPLLRQVLDARLDRLGEEARGAAGGGGGHRAGGAARASGRRWPRRTRTALLDDGRARRSRRGCWPRRRTARRCASPTR